MKRIFLTLAILTALCSPSFAAQYAKNFDALMTSQRSAGVTLAGGFAQFVTPGASPGTKAAPTNLKAVYSNRLKTVASANPLTLSSDGQALVFGDGLYDVYIYNSAGVLKYTWQGVEIKSKETELSYCFAGADLTLAQAAVSADCANNTVVVTTALTAGFSNISSASLPGGAWPSDRKLKVEKGGSIGNTTQFTINAPFEAGAYQVFTGTGTVSFGAGAIHEAYPEWWGAVTDEQSTGFDSGAAIRKAVAATGVPKLVFAAGTYNISMVTSSGTTFLITDSDTTKFGFVTSNNLVLQGSGKYKSYLPAQDSTHKKTQLHFTGIDSTSVGMYLNTPNVEVKNIEFYMDAVTAGAVAIKGYGRYNVIKECAVRADKGINITYSMNTIIEDNKLYVSAEGIKIDQGTSFSVARNYVAGSATAGSKAIYLGDKSKVTSPSANDTTNLSGISRGNIIEQFDYGHYLDPAHGVTSGAFSGNLWNSSQVIITGNYYELVSVYAVWGLDAHVVVKDDIVNSATIAKSFPYLTWNKTNAAYRYPQLQNPQVGGITTDKGLFIGTVNSGQDTDAAQNAIVLKPDTTGTPKVRILSTGTGTPTRKSELEWRDKHTDYGYVARYNRDNVSVYGANVAAGLHIYPITAGTEGTPVATFAQTYTAITNQTITTASLPAAGAAMDGRIVLEDGGAGDGNLIIYVAGQRYRINGGTAF